MTKRTKVLVGQSGGPTSAINSSLLGVYDAAHAEGFGVLGMRNGIEGLSARKVVDLERILGNPVKAQQLRHTPSSFLGSCRYKLPTIEEDEGVYQRLFALFDEFEVGAVCYIGGNDSMDTISKLSAYGALMGSDISFVGVPKTIDNDLVGTDHTPGYGSAAKFIATVVAEVARDSSVYDLKSVTFIEIMGRNAGWLAGSASLANIDGSGVPDLILLPERPVTEDAVTERIARVLDSGRQTVVVAVSEGTRHPDGTLMCAGTPGALKLDAFGHEAALSGTSRYLASIVGERLGVKTRAVELSTLQRCATHMASYVDLHEAYNLGGAAARAAMVGCTGKLPIIERISDMPYLVNYSLADVADVANQEKHVPDKWIGEDGMGVTEDFVRYARPLIKGEVTPFYVGGIPHHIDML